MALTPVAYTKNWSDTFGSQIIPTEANAGTAAKKDPIALTDGPRITTGSTVSVTFNHADQMEIDWGDGTVEPHNPGAGAKTHVYARNGNYQIWCKVIQAPDIRVVAPIRISSIAPNVLTPAFAVTMTELVAAVTATGVVLPVDVDFGDGTVERKWTNNFNHTYAAAGTYTVSIRDVTGWRASAQAIAADAAPPPAPSAAPNPWEGMTRHDQLNEYIDDANITPTDEWTTMTIADKKAWLTENYAK